MDAATLGAAASTCHPATAGEGNVEGVGQAFGRVAVELQTGNGGSEQTMQAVAQRCHACGFMRQRGPRQPRRLAQGDDMRHILGAGTQAVFVAGAVLDRFERDARSNIQRPHALGGVKLVAGQGQQVGAQRLQVHRHLADGLGCIDVHQRARGMREIGQRAHGLQAAGLVVGQHHRHQRHLRRDEVHCVIHLHPAGRIHRQFGD